MKDPCNVCGEIVEEPCGSIACETEKPKYEDGSMIATRMLKEHFKVSEVDQEFVGKLVSEIIKNDQIARMGSLIQYLKTEEVK